MLGGVGHSNNITYKGAGRLLTNYLPIAGIAGAVGLAAYDVHKAKPEEKKEHFLRNMFLLTAGAVILGIIFKKWMINHPALGKLFKNSEHAMEHIAAHTSPEANMLIAKSPVIRGILRRSSGKSAAEVQTLIRKVLPMEAERVLPKMLGRYGGYEAELLTSRLEPELTGLAGKFAFMESKLPYFDEAAAKMVARLVESRGAQVTTLGKKIFYA